MSDISEVRYRDRRTGEIVTELLIQPTLQRWIFGNALVFRLFNFLLNNTLFCWVYGKLQTRPVSAKKIPVFLQQYRINTDEFEHPPEYYTSFNAFFIRRLKSNARPFHPDPDIFCSPADGKVVHVRKLADERTRISIFLNVFDVHVNRTPIAGTVTQATVVSEHEQRSSLLSRRGVPDHQVYLSPLQPRLRGPPILRVIERGVGCDGVRGEVAPREVQAHEVAVPVLVEVLHEPVQLEIYHCQHPR